MGSSGMAKSLEEGGSRGVCIPGCFFLKIANHPIQLSFLEAFGVFTGVAADPWRHQNTNPLLL